MELLSMPEGRADACALEFKSLTELCVVGVRDWQGLQGGRSRIGGKDLICRLMDV